MAKDLSKASLSLSNRRLGTDVDGHLKSKSSWHPSACFPHCVEILQLVCPKVSLSAYFTKIAVALMPLKQGWHTEATGSRVFEM